MALIGYARCSTTDQHIDVQTTRLREAGCDRIFVDDGVSGAKASRPEWDRCLAYLREGDVLVSVKLDRFGRSTKHLLEVAADLEARGVGLKCLDQPIDTTTSVGRLLFTILAAVAEFERGLIIERTNAGLAAAKARGRNGGRPKSWTPQQQATAHMLKAQDAMSAEEIAGVLGVSRATYYRMVSDLQPVGAALAS
jgi:DNA invertase Pin-like site-specific DNA recombinase